MTRASRRPGSKRRSSCQNRTASSRPDWRPILSPWSGLPGGWPRHPPLSSGRGMVTEEVGRHPESVDVLVELAELLGAAVIDFGDRFCFPSDHPLNLTGADEVLDGADLVLALDVRDFYGALAEVDRVQRRSVSRVAPGCRLVEIGLGDLGIRSWSQDSQRLQPADLSILADTSIAPPALTVATRRLLGPADGKVQERAGRHARRHALLRREWAERARKAADDVPIATAHLAGIVGE